MAPLGLRARLVAAFVGLAALTTLVAALLTSVGLHHQVDAYLDQRADSVVAAATAGAQSAFAQTNGWTPQTLDLLSRELALTGYDVRLIANGRTLLDTTRPPATGTPRGRIASVPVRSRAGDEVGTLQLYAPGTQGNLPADDALRSELDRAHLISAAIAAVVAIIAGMIVAGHLSRPLRRLTDAARGLAAGGATIPRSSGSREVRELGQALAGLADDLGRQQRARHQLAQDLSHELRTPLMLLQGRIEAMQDGVVPFDAGGLGALHTQTLRLGRLIGQIERLAEAEAHPLPLHVEGIALDDLARETGATLAEAFDVRGLTLDVDAPPTSAWGDRDAVIQIATNLLSNALKYAPDHSVVRLSTTQEGERALLRVCDAGRGLSGSESARIFERFYRGVDASAMRGGAGLGLTIARDLAVAQGGGLALEPDDAGTCFALWLPTKCFRS